MSESLPLLTHPFSSYADKAESNPLPEGFCQTLHYTTLCRVVFADSAHCSALPAGSNAAQAFDVFAQHLLQVTHSMKNYVLYVKGNIVEQRETADRVLEFFYMKSKIPENKIKEQINILYRHIIEPWASWTTKASRDLFFPILTSWWMSYLLKFSRYLHTGHFKNNVQKFLKGRYRSGNAPGIAGVYKWRWSLCIRWVIC